VLFSSLIFLFAFLPIVLFGYFLLRGNAIRNAFLLLASLFFYAWGEPSFLCLMVLLIAMNYLFGLLISRRPNKNWLLAIAVGANLLILGYFKYCNFFLGTLHAVWPATPLSNIALPLGISFITFHCLSYLIDVFRGKSPAQKNPITVGLYFAFFPQLIAGPIVRFHEICDQLQERAVSKAKFAEGVRRFIIGLGKKMLIANTLAEAADAIFAQPATGLSTSLAWLAAFSYMLQIYFDFSGYSDMAIGLASMFGFTFPENFNFPYIAQSIREFWQRWHITLSNWFRDYLYIPLGGSRGGAARTSLNLVIVFFLCGLWHGAAWTFVIWGLYHGLFLGLERLGLDRLLSRIWRPFRHIYALAVVLFGWIIFRANSVEQMLLFSSNMLGLAQPSLYAMPVEHYMSGRVLLAMLLGTVASTPFLAWLERLPVRQWLFNPALRTAALISVFFLSISELAASSYNPFIYFRF
jgi:alginate O-acetyltransferase complex protein AlgI